MKEFPHVLYSLAARRFAYAGTHERTTAVRLGSSDRAGPSGASPTAAACAGGPRAEFAAGSRRCWPGRSGAGAQNVLDLPPGQPVRHLGFVQIIGAGRAATDAAFGQTPQLQAGNPRQ